MHNIKFTDLIGKEFIASDGNKEKFYNCWMCAKEVYKKFGIELSFHYLIDSEDKEGINSIFDEHKKSGKWERIEIGNGEELEIPCIVAIRFNSPIYVNHVGVYIGDGKFIHCRERIGVNITEISSPAWNRRIEGYYKWIQV